MMIFSEQAMQINNEMRPKYNLIRIKIYPNT